MQSFRQQTPLNTCVEKELYTVELEDGQKIRDIEKILSSVETAAAPAIQKASQRKELEEQELGAMAMFLSFLLVRLPTFLKSTQQIAERDAQRTLFDLFPDEETTRRRLEEDPPKGYSGCVEEAKSLFEFVRSGRYELKVDDQFALFQLLSSEKELREVVWNLDWTFAWAPPKSTFITSDSPFTLFSPEGTRPLEIGILTPGILKLIPLSPSCMIVLEEPGTGTTYRQIPRAVINEFNTYVAVNSERFVIARDELLLRKVVKRARLNKGPSEIKHTFLV